MFVSIRFPLAGAMVALLLFSFLAGHVAASEQNSPPAGSPHPAADTTQAKPDLADESEDQADSNDSRGESTDKEKAKADEDKAAANKEDNRKADKKDADEQQSKSDDGDSAGKKEAEADNAKKSDTPKPFTVKKKPLKIEQTLEGIFVASEMEEVALRPDTWTRYTVVEAVEHGKEVKKGDVLVKFDAEDIEERLADETIDQRLNELALMQAEEEAPRDEKLLKLAYESAKRTYNQLVEDHKYYQETDRPFAERIANYRYDSSKEDLASQEEELAQLKKMYEADEITEETEAIVLRRQEFEVRTAKLMLELQTASRDYTLNVSLPRNDLFYTMMLEQTKLAMDKAQAAMELGTTRSKYELEKKRAARARSLQNNAKLLSDRELMELKSPVDGVAYYGRCVSGQWAEIGSMTTKLAPHSAIPPNTVLMTIVQQRPLHVLTNVGEKEFPQFKDGMPAAIELVADTDEELDAKVTRISGVPGGGKKFEMRLDVKKNELPEWLVAGMSCNIKIVTYDKKDALLIPEEMVQTDKDDDRIKYVMLVSEDEDEPVRREVKLGKKKDKQVEVIAGLKAGDKIVRKDPKKGDDSDE